jgi:hypothetical protein
MSGARENTKDQKSGNVALDRDEYPEQCGLNGPTFSAERGDSRVVDQSTNNFDLGDFAQAPT